MGYEARFKIAEVRGLCMYKVVWAPMGSVYDSIKFILGTFSNVRIFYIRV